MRASPATWSSFPRIYLGTMTFGWKGQTSSFIDDPIASQMLDKFSDFQSSLSSSFPASSAGSSPPPSLNNNAVCIDTARIYSGGDSERMLGDLLSRNQENKNADKDRKSIMSIGSKAHPSQPHGLSPQGLETQLQTSLDVLKLPSIDEYYLHQPDPDHPLLDSLRIMHSFVERGLISTVGMSNYHVSEVRRAFELCEIHGWTKPRVYQGLYNPLNRLVEQELLQVLHEHDCAFVAYNPLAAGMLTGKHLVVTSSSSSSSINDSIGREVLEGRFKNNPNYLPRFYTPSNFDAVECIQKACQDANISMVEASYRWLLCHSKLDGTKRDGLLIGASSLEQLDQNLDSCLKAINGDLPSSVIEAFDQAWDIVSARDQEKEQSQLGQPVGPFPYWRSYSLDMPDRDNLDPGASYNAAKTK